MSGERTVNIHETANPTQPNSAYGQRGWKALPFATHLSCLTKRELYRSPHVIMFPDCYFHIPLPIVTKHGLGLPFLPRNLPIKFGTNPSAIFLVIVVTDKPTPVKNILPRFRGDNKTSSLSSMWVYHVCFGSCSRHCFDAFDQGWCRTIWSKRAPINYKFDVYHPTFSKSVFLVLGIFPASLSIAALRTQFLRIVTCYNVACLLL